jgi:initiation factor 1A
MPGQGELLGRVIKLVGGDNIIVRCTDGKVRTCRIRGKIKRRCFPFIFHYTVFSAGVLYNL